MVQTTMIVAIEQPIAQVFAFVANAETTPQWQEEIVDVTLEQLRQGDRVTYTAENDPRGKGPRASGVRLVTE